MNIRKKAEMKNRIVVLVIVLFLSYLIWTVITQQVTINQYKTQKMQMEQKLADEQKITEELKDKKVLQGTDEYLESQARDKLGLVKGGEKVFLDTN